MTCLTAPFGPSEQVDWPATGAFATAVAAPNVAPPRRTDAVNALVPRRVPTRRQRGDEVRAMLTSGVGRVRSGGGSMTPATAPWERWLGRDTGGCPGGRAASVTLPPKSCIAVRLTGG